MAERRPIAFLSYVRADDDHDQGRITAFRTHLEGEVKMQTGRSFAIFQDRNDIAWGQNWEERINNSLLDVTFLIPILTPSFFESPACRAEFQTFSLKEKTLGANRLILPVYYVDCDQLEEDYPKGKDEIVDILRKRNWTDWRQFRFKKFDDESVAKALADLGAMVKASIKELESIDVISKAKAEPAHSEEKRTKEQIALPEIISEAQILSAERGPLAEDATGSSSQAYDIREVADLVGNKQEWDLAIQQPYYVYTRKYDEVVDAASMAEEAELLKLFGYVSSFSEALKKIYEPALSKLLGGLRPVPGATALAVTLLVDNSGSMRGRKIINTASWCMLLSEWMERLGIPNEILGYTTRAWKGGQSRELWLQNGKPTSPGRLNDIRHIIYKSFSSSIAAAAPSLGVMAREGILKENIDGEALLWAASRLQKHAAPNKIMFVLSDGAPVDDSTLSVNAENFLERHLRDVISYLSKSIQLFAVGIEHDVSIYYPNAVTDDDVGHLGLRVISALIKNPMFVAAFEAPPPFEKMRLIHDFMTSKTKRAKRKRR